MKRKVLEGLNSAKLVELLKEDPSLSSKFDEYSLWNRIYPISWSWLLYKRPQFADKCDKWEEFSAWDWYELFDQPQFEEKAKQYPSGWAAILTQKPELARDCDKWEKFSAEDWSWLLESRPQFADKCDKWEEFSAWDWYELFDQPQFEEKAKQYPSGWAAILTQKPELARDCDKWGEFSAEDWSSLLKFQPQFADMRNKQI